MPHPFRFGIISEHMHSPAGWLDQARRAEACGYSTFLMRDHFAPDFFGDQFAPFSALMAAAMATTQLRVGTMVIGNDYRHPVVLAKEAATLDLFSGGRFELGLGAGWLRSEYEQAGMPFDAPGTRVSRLEEAICVIKGLFCGEAFSFHGDHYSIANLCGYPLPAQRPHPPILIGAGSKRMLQLAGREANAVGILTTSVRTGTLLRDPEERLAPAVAEKASWVRQGAGARADQVELSMIADLVVTNDRRSYAEQLIRTQGWDGISPEQVLEMPAILAGTEAEIVEQLLERRERFGFSYIVVDDESMNAFAPIVVALAGK